ncbi:hypothetical protein HRJ45_24365 [Vibrio coralliilyticus]|uniref:hypothetical protein n=1 Tax=Vibrio coralliilyticus TaxID=190893 RepID=UPI0015608166|nr:hypothetical protein [Vibrio coralliilyticus]NRF28133.1 hypothetical protein [Vibrio coralliilyticus]NRF82247.1 hypothetical protein [Vibrio coralliilyticus]
MNHKITSVVCKIIPLLFFLSLLTPIPALATVDRLLVNDLTKEVFWQNEEHVYGLIGWKAPDITKADRKGGEQEVLSRTYERYLSMEYTETNFPFKIEMCLLVTALLLFLFYNSFRA